MKEQSLSFTGSTLVSIYLFSLMFFTLLVAGCVSVGKPQLNVDQYLLDYKTPVFEKQPLADDSIRMERFTIAAAWNSRNMVIRYENGAIDHFNYNQWAVNPADMVGDNLLRDLRQSGLFRAVFSRYTPGEGRFVVNGAVEEFFLRMDKAGQIAVAGLTITLYDTKQRDTTKRILFQRKYQEEKHLADSTPAGYCAAMGMAQGTLSRRIINDVYQAVIKAKQTY